MLHGCGVHGSRADKYKKASYQEEQQVENAREVSVNTLTPCPILLKLTFKQCQIISTRLIHFYMQFKTLLHVIVILDHTVPLPVDISCSQTYTLHTCPLPPI